MRRVLFLLAALLAAVLFGPLIVTPLMGWGADARLRPPPGKSIAISESMSINVVESGSGSPVVLVHGLPSNAYDWASFTTALSGRGYHVIAYDRIGYGYSSRSPADDNRYTLESNAADLRALLDALNLQRVDLIGWSYGGGVAQTFAAQSPERVSHLVLVASVGPAQPPEGNDALGLVLRSPIGAFILRWVASVPLLARSMTHDSLVQVFARPEAIPTNWIEYTQAMLALPGTTNSFVLEDQRAHYEQMRPENVQVPTLILQGTEDHSVPPAVADDLHRRIRDSKLVTIPGGSHMMSVTNPDVLAAHVVSFLQSTR